MPDCSACGESNPTKARFCLGCGSPLGRDKPAQELRRSVTVIFADLVGSTLLGEALDAEALRYVTGRYFDTMRAAIERHEGTVEKFIGDAVVAVFGVPRVHEDDAVRAVRAASDMRTSMTTLNLELEADLGVTLQVRIGVNTGEVIVGERRAGGSLATGDAVNVAARLEQAAGPGEVLIGDNTHRLVRRWATVEPIPPLELKGKAASVTAWRLVDITGPHTSAKDPAGASLVGRDTQLRLMEDVFRRARDERTCQLLTVLGAAGVGKSRLAEEFVAGRSDALVLVGRCLSYGEGATYWPLREAVLHAVGLTGDEPLDIVANTLTAALGVLADAANIVTRLLSLVALNRRSPVPEDVPWAVRMFFEHLARHRPLVLVVDDLHWAEPGLIDVLEHIADWSRDAPIMLVALARPEFYESRPTWGGGKFNATALLLSPLEDRAALSLIEKHNLPDDVRRHIVDAAGGNPLFVHQLVAMLVDDGHATLEDGVATWVGGPTAHVGLPLPPSVAALLTARIDGLSDAEQQIIGGAAVMGAVFYVEALAELTGLGTVEVRQLLDQLMRKELLRPAPSDLPGLSAYRFLHILVRDAAYDGLSKAHRAEWHERFADWISAIRVDAVPEEIVGHHLASAWEYRRQLGPATDHTRELARRAARKLAAAGRRLDLSDVVAASKLIQRAVDMLDPADPERIECMLGLSMQRLELGEINEALDILRVATKAADPRQAVLAEVLLCRAKGYTTEHRVDECEGIVDGAIQRFHEWGDERGLALAYLVQVDLANYKGQLSRATELLALAMKHGEAANDAGCIARARSVQTVILLFGPTAAEDALAALDQMVAESGNDPRVRAEAEQASCVLHAMCGRFDQARALASLARRHLAEVGHSLFLANLAQSTGHLEEIIGDVDAAEREYERSCAALAALGEQSYLSTVAGLHGRLLARQGKRELAIAALETARAHGSTDDVTTQSLVRQTVALLAAGAGEVEPARAAVAAALEMSIAGEEPDASAEARVVAADVEEMLGCPAPARAHLLMAQQLFQAKGNIARADYVDGRLPAARS